jgi:ATP-dependent Lon protease
MGTKGVPPSGIDPPPGVAMATAIVSVMAGIPVRRDLAMTGEITLRGRVWPIAGLKEKLLAALRGGIKTVLIPEENAKDLVENRGQHQEWARDRSGVRTENSILIGLHDLLRIKF